MSPRLKKNLEAIVYLTIEVVLAFLLAKWGDLPEELRPILTIAMVYFGKQFIKFIKE